MPAPMTAEKFWRKVDRSAGGNACWPWKGSLYQKGYGQVGWNRRKVRAHRAAYELSIGPIPDGLVIDHVCRNRQCCNPEHLRAVTLATNSTENSASPPARNKLKTHCNRGHPLSGDNLRVYRGRRSCRACKADWEHQKGLEQQ